LPDQFIDLTKRRDSTFFGGGAVAHVSMAQPVCAAVAGALARAARRVLADEAPGHGATLHEAGTYVCIEGPQFSSQAESHWFRSMGASVIGMTNMPEAKLAREAQMAYATLALVTDFDCWHPREAHVSADLAMANLFKNAARAQQVAGECIRLLGAEQPASDAHSALKNALVTQPEAMAPEVRARLAALLG
ncbi:MAG: S-methyl-5'-thioadenosine phosphorylase, partial [Polaromonas sp.]|nr:S-methyl-5'-thioadenosine phosphorylase [Polaromonas sp.]